MASILVVEDTEADQIRLSRMLSVGNAHDIHISASGDEAFEIVTNKIIDLVITNLRTPKIDGLELLERLQDEFPRVPVIVMSDMASEELTVSAIQQGAAGYLKKNSTANRLNSIVARLLAGRAVDLAHVTLLRRQEFDEYEFKLPSRRVLMSATAGFLRQRILASEICPEKELLRLGIALEESLLNACLHGNLELDSALREQDGDVFESLADERSELSPWKDRHIYINASVNRERARFTVRDEGFGFDPASLPDPTDPENLLKPHGRGVMIMKLFMDEVSWNASGNEVTMVKHAVEAIESQ